MLITQKYKVDLDKIKKETYMAFMKSNITEAAAIIPGIQTQLTAGGTVMVVGSYDRIYGTPDVYDKVAESNILGAQDQLGTVGTLAIVNSYNWMYREPDTHHKLVDSFSMWFNKLDQREELDYKIETIPETLHDFSKDKYEVTGYDKITQFCEEHKLEKACDTYINIASRMFRDAKMTLSLVSDPEIEDDIKINLKIKTKSDIESLLKLDYEFFRALDIAFLDPREKSYFVKTYEIIE